MNTADFVYCSLNIQEQCPVKFAFLKNYPKKKAISLMKLRGLYFKPWTSILQKIPKHHTIFDKMILFVNRHLKS